MDETLRAPVHSGMALSYSPVVSICDQEWRHSKLVELHYESPHPYQVGDVYDFRLEDWMTLYVPCSALDIAFPALDNLFVHMIGVPVSYRVRWEPHIEQSVESVWRLMADTGLIVYDRLIIHEKRVV